MMKKVQFHSLQQHHSIQPSQPIPVVTVHRKHRRNGLQD